MSSPLPSSPLINLAVALGGAGWHPAAWREPDARPADLFTAGYWLDAVREAERAAVDFVTLEDGLGLQSDDPATPDARTDRVRGRLDAVLVASRVAPLTRHIGLVPTVTVTHTEPFHLSKAVATLDYVSAGRAGVRIAVSTRPDEAAHFGRRDIAPPSPDALADHFAEASDYVEVLRGLWDSWEDDAEIRDVATGRFVDRDKLHYLDFRGRWFAVKGPSITPRPPQGQPVVAALGHGDEAYRLIARSADIGFVTARDTAHAASIVDTIAAYRQAQGRADEPVRVFADLAVALDDSDGAAQARLRRLDDVAPWNTDARVFAGTAARLADLLQKWHGAGVSGFRLRPVAVPHDLVRITRELVPELRRRQVFRQQYEAATLRGLLGFARPDNRFAAAREALR